MLCVRVCVCVWVSCQCLLFCDSIGPRGGFTHSTQLIPEAKNSAPPPPNAPPPRKKLGLLEPAPSAHRAEPPRLSLWFTVLLEIVISNPSCLLVQRVESSASRSNAFPLVNIVVGLRAPKKQTIFFVVVVVSSFLLVFWGFLSSVQDACSAEIGFFAAKCLESEK